MDASNAHSPNDRELKKALQAAVSKPFDEVDWDGLHGRVMADAETHFARAPGHTCDWVAAWSPRGIPFAAAGLAAAIASLWILPITGPTRGGPPPEFWPVAEELVSSLPESTRHLLNAGSDVDSMLRAVLAYEGRER